MPGFSRKNKPIMKFRLPAEENSSSSEQVVEQQSNSSLELLPSTVLVRVNYFSVNYADICIRWGLYDSANKFVGWPIVPGFDISGTVEWAGSTSGFSIGDRVFGATFFGAYSTRVLVPAW